MKDVLTIILPGGGFFGLAGIVVRYGVSSLPQEKRVKIMYWVLGLGFILTAGILAMFFFLMERDGGQQHLSLKTETENVFRLASMSSYVSPCPDVKLGEFNIWMSFSSDKPYYIVHENQLQLRVELSALDGELATFQVWQGGDRLTTGRMLPRQVLDFIWKGCQYQLTYMGPGSSGETGARYLFKERKTAKYNLRQL